MKKFMILGLAIILMGISDSNAYAHFLWVNADNYFPEVGEEITISLGWGHHFPNDGQMKADKLSKIYMIGPKGEKLDLNIKPIGEKGVVSPIKVKLENSGTYLVVVEKKSGFVTKTTQGYKYQSKDNFNNAIKGYWSEGNAKAIVTVKKAGGDAFKSRINQRFEVIPFKNPGQLKEQDYLPVRLLLDGKPHKSYVYATYEGFSEDKDTFAYTTRIDKEGNAKIRLLKNKTWLIKANDELPYSDPEKADVFSFTSTITFGVK